MSLIAKQEFIAELTGQVNGSPLTVVGGGEIEASGGIATGRYQIERLPPDFDPAILSGCLLTGYPNVCAVKSGVANPFGTYPYHYTRKLTFRSGGELQLTTTCGYEDGRLISSFHVDGDVRTPAITDVEPIIETWERAGDGAIDGNFVITWRTADGTRFTADARSRYVIEGTFSLECLFHRHIDVTPSYLQGVFSLYQESSLFAGTR